MPSKAQNRRRSRTSRKIQQETELPLEQGNLWMEGWRSGIQTIKSHSICFQVPAACLINQVVHVKTIIVWFEKAPLKCWFCIYVNASGICKSATAQALAGAHFYSRKIHCGVMEKTPGTSIKASEPGFVLMSCLTLGPYGTEFFIWKMQVLFF